MKEILATATLKTNVSNIDDARTEVNRIFSRKDKSIQTYANKNKLLNISIEMMEMKGSIVFVFAAITSEKLSAKTKKEFINIIENDFIIIDDGSPEMGTLKELGVDMDSLRDFYKNHFDLLESMECFYETNGITDSYMSNIEKIL